MSVLRSWLVTDTLSPAAILVITVGSSVRAVIPSLIKEKGIEFDDVMCGLMVLLMNV